MKNLVRYQNSFFPTLNREDFFSPLEDVFNDFYNDFFVESDIVKKASETKFPKFNITEYDGRVEFEAELAGMKKEDVDIELKEDEDKNVHYLTIRGHSKNQKEEKDKGKIILKELKKSSFSRTFTLQSNILDCDINNINASFDAGILKLSINKKEQKKVDKDKVKKVKIK